MSLYFVYLRQPKGLEDPRNDPFWEFGSFGVTGCHRKNLLHPRRSPLSNGDRLAFLQGGSGEVRMVGLTPEIKVRGSLHQLEITWNKSYRPIPYEMAPIFINNHGYTDFPAILPMLAGVQRSTFCGAVGSRFRSRSTPIEDHLAEQVFSWFGQPELLAIDIYASAIHMSDHPWHREAVRCGWVDPMERRRRYRELKGESAEPDLDSAIQTVPNYSTKCGENEEIRPCGIPSNLEKKKC